MSRTRVHVRILKTPYLFTSTDTYVTGVCRLTKRVRLKVDKYKNRTQGTILQLYRRDPIKQRPVNNCNLRYKRIMSSSSKRKDGWNKDVSEFSFSSVWSDINGLRKYETRTLYNRIKRKRGFFLWIESIKKNTTLFQYVYIKCPQFFYGLKFRVL